MAIKLVDESFTPTTRVVADQGLKAIFDFYNEKDVLRAIPSEDILSFALVIRTPTQHIVMGCPTTENMIQYLEECKLSILMQEMYLTEETE